jgi:hypothetical protein
MLDVGCYVFMSAKNSAVFDYNISNATKQAKIGQWREINNQRGHNKKR